ncbi:protein-disulfide reductase DsbD family protein [Paraburkholderia fungorum]|jgi:thiol:disulfide interchange protein DsbD|uniref:Thiol:disulfide interchange protein n=1 Tax=Paraburkholderia fungorum TaxID=134537 RepID=A0AAW3UZI3_9BURK|nr:protein-disulfide reductase DsbD family protein [Paraburkholderia fungorum]MBB4518594.1 thiol:disulfide interchange protein [Paraburkholderia fungorum]MBB6204079.1 thiol:disulfide interchange protein [Paraburkholderia fungorum]
MARMGRIADLLHLALHTAIGLLVALNTLTTHSASEANLLPAERAFPLEISLSGPQQVDRAFKTHPGYYLYRNHHAGISEVGKMQAAVDAKFAPKG